MATTKKTWLEVKKQLDRTFDKWMNTTLRCEIITPTQIGGNPLPRGWATKAAMAPEDRAVTVTFVWKDRMERVARSIRITTYHGARPVDNLARIATALETMRLAEGRSTHKIMMKLYRQMYPAEPRTQEPPRLPPPPKQAPSSGPYAALHLANDAPVEVAEAAYRVLSKLTHPDYGGTNDAMRLLNAAIEQIRKVKSK